MRYKVNLLTYVLFLLYKKKNHYKKQNNKWQVEIPFNCMQIGREKVHVLSSLYSETWEIRYLLHVTEELLFFVTDKKNRRWSNIWMQLFYPLFCS